MTAELRGRTALVTGAGTGIGRGIAVVLAQRGATVVAVGRRAAPLDATVAAITAAGGRALPFVADVTDRRGIASVAAAAARAIGGFDILVNNAGIGGPNACALPGPDRWDEILRTNVDGVYFTTCAVLPHLRDGGRIVAISSVLGRFGVPGYTGYCASKHAVIGFTKALALELAPRRITVNAICPGWVDTGMAKAGMELIAAGTGTDYEQARAAALAAVPLGRILQPEEIGATVAFLCSDGAAGMTGQAISQCGGQVMW